MAPALEDMRMLRENEGAWWFICDELLPVVVGTTIWERQSVAQKVSAIATVSDVAFCLLTVENNWDYWIGIAAPNLEKNTDNDQHDKKNFTETPSGHRVLSLLEGTLDGAEKGCSASMSCAN